MWEILGLRIWKNPGYRAIYQEFSSNFHHCLEYCLNPTKCKCWWSILVYPQFNDIITTPKGKKRTKTLIGSYYKSLLLCTHLIKVYVICVFRDRPSFTWQAVLIDQDQTHKRVTHERYLIQCKSIKELSTLFATFWELDSRILLCVPAFGRLS